MSTSEPNVNNLFPAIAQSFAVILLGYVFGRFRFIAPEEVGSISKLVGRLFLPALLFFNLATLNLSTICWPFMAGLLIAKLAVFGLTAIVTLVVTRPVSLGKAGLFGIFATQSNDFALGLPIVQALYSQESNVLGQFQYVNYIYLLAPISLAIVNPLGFFMMEYEKQKVLRNNRKESMIKQLLTLLGHTVRGVILNPIVLMTLLGIIWNVIAFYGVNKGHSPAEHNVPSWLAGFLTILGNAYAACALFLIGLFMVGKLQKLTGLLILSSTVLIFAKTILLPIIDFLVVSRILPHGSQNSTSEDISTFAFLYGTFPTAPTVFVYAVQYNIAMAIIASSIVLCTLMSAPIMYISARMVLVHYATADNYGTIIETTRRDTSAVAIAGLMWVFFLFLVARRYRSFTHIFIMHLMVAMLLECISGELLNVFRDHGDIYWLYFCFAVFFASVLASRLWMAALGIGLLLLLWRGERRAEKAWLPLMLFSWGVPAILSVIMVCVSASHYHEAGKKLVDVSFLFGTAQLVVTFLILLSSFLVGMICTVVMIVMVNKRRRRMEHEHEGPHTEASNDQVKLNSASRRITQTPRGAMYGSTLTGRAGSPISTSDSDNSLQLSDNSGTCSRMHTPPSTPPPPVTYQRSSALDTYQETQGEVENEEEPSDTTPLLTRSSMFGALPLAGLSPKDMSGQQLASFIVLLLFLLFSCLVGLLIVVWKLTRFQISGLFIAVNILDTVTNFGQLALVEQLRNTECKFQAFSFAVT